MGKTIGCLIVVFIGAMFLGWCNRQVSNYNKWIKSTQHRQIDIAEKQAEILWAKDTNKDPAGFYTKGEK